MKVAQGDIDRAVELAAQLRSEGPQPAARDLTRRLDEAHDRLREPQMSLFGRTERQDEPVTSLWYGEARGILRR